MNSIIAVSGREQDYFISQNSNILEKSISIVNKHQIWKREVFLNEEEIKYYNDKFFCAKRATEWLLGRKAAKVSLNRVLENLNLNPLPQTDIYIKNSPVGVPFVNLSIDGLTPVVSISHKDENGIAWATMPGFGGGLPGIDIEKIHETSPEFKSRYLLPVELEYISSLSLDEQQFLPMLFWSIKESAFKALHYNGNFNPSKILIVPLDDYSLHVVYHGKYKELYEQVSATRILVSWKKLSNLIFTWVLLVDARLRFSEIIKK